jgi:excisionase family DNA binding protein
VNVRYANLATVKDLAEYAGVPVKTVYEWNYRGTGPKAIRVGRYLRFRWDDIESWIERNSADAA